MVNGSRSVNGLHCSSWVNDRAIELLMSNDDVLVMWTRANVDMLVWLLTKSDDVIGPRQMTSAGVLRCVVGA